jgi:hypothetical protein
LLGGFAPSPDERRDREQAAALHRACDSAAPTEICSGGPLNVILADLKKRSAEPGSADDSPALDNDVLAHLNVTAAGDDDSNFGLLRDGGKLRWPAAWEGAPLDEPSRDQRAELQADLQTALARWKAGQPSVRLLNRLRDEVQALDDLLRKTIREMAPSSYITAKEYVTQLGAAVRLLGRDDAARYVKGDYALDRQDIHTVRDLVVFMGKHDLRFAPAVRGDRSAYAALHRALASYEERKAPPPVSALDRGAL